MQRARKTIGPLPGSLSAAISSVPMFHAAWLFAGGIALAHVVWLRPSLLLIALAPVGILCCVAAFRAQAILWLPVATLWCLLGAWCAEMEPRPVPAPTIATLSDGLLRTVEGTIVNAGPLRRAMSESGHETSNDAAVQRIDLRVSSIELVNDAEDVQVGAEGGVRLTVRWPENGAQSDSRAFGCGERIRAVVRLLPPEIYRDPGVWSRTEYLLDQGITSTAPVDLDRVEDLGPGTRSSLACRMAGWQHAASARLLEVPARAQWLPAAMRLSQEDAIMLAAMITGDRTYLDHTLRAGFERTGSFHMLVVSGFHLAILAGSLFWLARCLRVPRVPAIFIVLSASLGYAMLTGFAVPIQRSLLMVTLYAIGSVFYRTRNPMNAIGFASLCLLALSPHALFDSSLQMTLIAVISIGGIAVPLLQGTVHLYLRATRDLTLVAIDVKLHPELAQFRVTLRMIARALQKAVSRTAGWSIFPRAVRLLLAGIELLAVSCVVELAMTLPMAVYFHRITVFALPVNIFLLPLLTVLMPAALLTLLGLFLWPWAGVLLSAAVAMLLHIGVGVVHRFGSLAAGDFRIPAPLLWQTGIFVGLSAGAIVLVQTEHAKRAGWYRAAACASLLLGALVVVWPRPIEHPKDALLVEALDVGQGDSLLLITPDGKTLLVDGGGIAGAPLRASQEFDVGEEVVSPALWSRGIRHLDVVALSHAHADHMGGLPAVLRNFRPAELWLGNNPEGGDYRALLDEAEHLQVRVRSLRSGDGLSLGESQVRVLAPAKDYEPGAEPSNNDSLVLHVAYGNTSVMLEGDAEAPIEQAMLRESELQSTLLKVSHHGSVSSTRPEFLARVAPKWAVISCGLHNRYGHPREEVLAELQSTHVRTYSTDIGGAVCFRLDGKNVTAAALCGNGSLQ